VGVGHGDFNYSAEFGKGNHRRVESRAQAQLPRVRFCLGILILVFR
jgi:hypothetical protein